MRALLVAFVGSGIGIPIIGASVRHWWTKRLQRRDEEHLQRRDAERAP